jgi:hypothetical protein
MSLIHLCPRMYRTEAVLRVFCQILYFQTGTILHMSVPDVMKEGHNLNTLSVAVQNLHNVCVRLIVYCRQILRIYWPLVTKL